MLWYAYISGTKFVPDRTELVRVTLPAPSQYPDVSKLVCVPDWYQTGQSWYAYQVGTRCVELVCVPSWYQTGQTRTGTNGTSLCKSWYTYRYQTRQSWYANLVSTRWWYKKSPEGR